MWSKFFRPCQGRRFYFFSISQRNCLQRTYHSLTDPWKFSVYIISSHSLLPSPPPLPLVFLPFLFSFLLLLFSNFTVSFCSRGMLFLLPYYCACFSWVGILGMSAKCIPFLLTMDDYIIVSNYSILLSLQKNYISSPISGKLPLVPWGWLYFSIPLSGLTVWLVLTNEIWAEVLSAFASSLTLCLLSQILGPQMKTESWSQSITDIKSGVRNTLCCWKPLRFSGYFLLQYNVAKAAS